MATNFGYKATVVEADKNMSKIAQVVNSTHLLMGVQGDAGLANIHPFPS